MHDPPLRGARRAAAPLALVAALAGCSASSHPASTAASTRPTATVTPNPAATTNPATANLLGGGATVSARLHAYTFSAIETVHVAKTVRSVIRGRLIRGRGVTYTLVAAGRTTQVVRIRNATYVRGVPGKWSRLRRPRPVADPSATLVKVLRGITAAHSTKA